MLLDSLLEESSAEPTEQALDRLLRIRAVQELEPSDAVGFILTLKQVVLRLLQEESRRDDAILMATHQLFQRVDNLVLQAFDVYMRCREQVFEIRLRDVKKRSEGVMERLNEWRARREESTKEQRTELE